MCWHTTTSARRLLHQEIAYWRMSWLPYHSIPVARPASARLVLNPPLPPVRNPYVILSTLYFHGPCLVLICVSSHPAHCTFSKVCFSPCLRLSLRGRLFGIAGDSPAEDGALMDSCSAPMEPLPQMPIASVDLSSEVWAHQQEGSLPSNILGCDSALSGKTGVSRRQLYRGVFDPVSYTHLTLPTILLV